MISRWVNLVDADLDAFSVVKKGYKEQFFEAMNVNGGDVQSATAFDYFMHFLAFPWKVNIIIFCHSLVILFIKPNHLS
jgi:solute carrier family 8 (sodium/calcium exchanger)